MAIKQMVVGIVLVPDSRTLLHAVQLSQQYGDLYAPGSAGEPIFPLKLRTGHVPLPHITLIQLKIEEANIQLLVDWMRVQAQRTEAPEGRLVRLRVSANRWLFWSSARTDRLVEVHLRFAQAASTFRSSDLSVDPTVLTGEMRRSLRQYGSPYCEDAWDPHITLGYLAERGGLPKDVEPPQDAVRDWFASALAVAKMGPKGTVVGLYATIPFAVPI